MKVSEPTMKVSEATIEDSEATMAKKFFAIGCVEIVIEANIFVTRAVFFVMASNKGDSKQWIK